MLKTNAGYKRNLFKNSIQQPGTLLSASYSLVLLYTQFSMQKLLALNAYFVCGSKPSSVIFGCLVMTTDAFSAAESCA